MKKQIASTLFGAALLLIGGSVHAQKNVNVDPGISIHNYKQPHKARMAKRAEVESSNSQVNFILPSRIGNRFSHTPKYANRPATVVLGATQVGKDFNLNPLDSPHHYKLHDTGSAKGSTSETRVAVTQPSQSTNNSDRVD